jgi:hypothetical protein
LNDGTSDSHGSGKKAGFHLLDPANLTFSEKTPPFFQNRDGSTEAVQGPSRQTTTIRPREGDAMAITGSSFRRHNAYEFLKSTFSC